MKKNVEMIKTAVLWILFLSSIALLVIRYNLMSHKIGTDYSLRVKPFSLNKDNIIPSHVIIKFNQYDITHILDDKDIYFTQTCNFLIQSLSSEATIKKIDFQEFKNIKKSGYVLLTYDKIPSLYLEKILELKDSIISDIGYIQEVLFPLNSQHIYIKTQDFFYEIKGNIKSSFKSVRELSSSNYAKYYPKFENINNNENLILPLNFNMQMSKINTKNILDEIKTVDIAKNILKDRFDFTSSLIQKNGDYFYSYNNGQEILKISNNGLIEYKNGTMENIKSDLLKSTETLFNFLDDLGIDTKKTVISSVKEIEKNSGLIYRFNLINVTNGIETLMQDGVSDSYVEVSGNIVVSCKLYLRYPFDSFKEKQNISDPSAALNYKIEEIQKIMNISEVEKILSFIKDIDLIYNMDTEGILSPSWKYNIGEYIFIIDAFTQELINYGMVKD